MHLRLLGSCDGCPSSAVTLRTRGRAGHRRGRAGDRDHRCRRAERSGCAGGDDRRRARSEARGGRPVTPPAGDAAGRGGRPAERAGPDPQHPPARPPASRRAVRPLRDAHPRRARARRRPGAAQPPLHLPRLLPAPHTGRRRRPALPRRARPLPVVPRLRALAGAVGQPADPGERGVLLRQLQPGAGRRLLPQPGRRDGVAAAPRHLGRHRGGPPGPGDAAARRRGLPRAVRRPGGGTAECYLVPIDACYEMVGQLRRLWRGFDGGQEAHDALDAFFDRIRGRAGSLRAGERQP